MGGIFLGGKYTKSSTVDFFLLLNDYRYIYIVSKYEPNYHYYQQDYHYYQQGSKSSCSTSGMVHVAPLKLVSWEW